MIRDQHNVVQERTLDIFFHEHGAEANVFSFG